jgi:hypothetical protein
MPDKQTSKPISTVSSDLRIGRSFLLQLAQAGHFHPVEVTDGRTHQPGIRIPDADVSVFQAQYVSRRYLSKSGAKAVAVKRELDARGVAPVFSSADGKEFIYLRADLPVI